MQTLGDGCFAQIADQARRLAAIAELVAEGFAQLKVRRDIQPPVIVDGHASRQQTAHAFQRRIFARHEREGQIFVHGRVVDLAQQTGDRQ